MPGQGGGFGAFYLATAIINAATSTVNSALARKQQNELTVKNQQFTERMEHNRQNFQLSLSEENAKLQREMSKANHDMRLLEQQNNFELMCKSAEWNHFEAEWPLWVRPMVLRSEQILDDDTVALRVLFSKSNNDFFTKYVFPEIEQGLVEFVDRYHNIFGSKNIIFYHNAFKDNYYGGAFNANVHYALKELPVLIIDSNVLNDEICVSATIWGFGNAQEQHSTLFKLPYKLEVTDGKIDKKYLKDLTNQILAYLKFVIGYAYDTYNLIMYNQKPLLPKVAAFELAQGIDSASLRFKGIKSAIGAQYEDIYTSVLAVSTDENQSFAEKPESYKKTILHELRLDYALSTKDYSSIAEYEKYLNESLKAWVELRSTLSVETFLKDLVSGTLSLQQYCSEDDKQYFIRLDNAYNSRNIICNYSDLCHKICTKLNGIKLEKAASTKVSLPPHPYPVKPKYGNSKSEYIDL